LGYLYDGLKLAIREIVFDGARTGIAFEQQLDLVRGFLKGGDIRSD
jgi:hypothetical protein